MSQFKHLLVLMGLLAGCNYATAGSNPSSGSPDIRLIGFRTLSDCSAYYSCSSIDDIPLVQVVGTQIRKIKFCGTQADVLSFASIDGVPLLDQRLGYRDDGRGRGDTIPWYGLDELQSTGHLETLTSFAVKIGACIELFDQSGNSLLKKTINSVEPKL